MKKLLNTLYITTPEMYLKLDGENVVVLQEGKEKGRVPLHNLEGIVTVGYTGASPALMGACAERRISLTFMSAHGRFLARTVGEEYGNVLLRKEQYRISDDSDRSLAVAKNILIGKLYNSRSVVERTCRDYPARVDIDKLKSVSAQLRSGLDLIQRSDSLEALRGVEGEAAARYFSIFDDLILQSKDDFNFRGRNKRPPLDNVNALLSFCYSLLAKDTAAALEAVGLDPYVGFLHRDRPGRISLALDLMEENRSIFADRFVLSIINRKMVSSKGFTKTDSGAVIMDDNTRKQVLKSWQERKQEVITHPFLNEKVEWGLISYVQALLLARYIRGDLEAYPPFMWK